MKINKLLFIACFYVALSAAAHAQLTSIDLRPHLQSYDGKISLLKTGPTKTRRGCEIKQIVLKGRDPVTNNIQAVSLFSYRPKDRTKRLTTKVLINPPTGGITFLDRGYALSLCKEGAEVALLDSWSGYQEPEKIDFGSHDRATIRAIFAGRYALEYLNAPTVILGTSVGAIYSSFIMGLDSRIIAAVLIVGGAPMVDVLTFTDQKIPATLREKRMKKFNILTQQDYGEILERNVRLSADDYTNAYRQQDLLMVIALKDKTVPTATQLSLWHSWGRPEKIDFKKNHVNTIVASALLKKKTIMTFILDRAGKSHK